MKASQRGTAAAETITPPVHLEFIQNQAPLPEAGGVGHIESYHRSIFLHQHARELERVREEAALHQERLAFLQGRAQGIQARLQPLDQFVAAESGASGEAPPPVPWNSWDRAMFTAAALAVGALLVFGVLNISFNLLESGLVTFVRNPVRAYFWAALLPVGALGVKIGWDLLPEAGWRKVYLWSCLALGLAGVMVWVGTYSTVYPTLSKSITEHLESLSVFDNSTGAGGGITPGGARTVDMLMVFAQAVAEIFLSAVLGIYMTILYTRHRPVRLATDPLFAQLEEVRLALERSMEQERLALAGARGQVCQLENQMSALVAFAKSIYQKQTSLHLDQNRQTESVLDQLSQHLRSQLESLPRSSAAAGNRPLSLPQSNGK